jgi:two-component system, cell cycle response regulator
MTLKILYVEDNPYNMRLVYKMLKVMNYEILEAVDGLMGLQMATDIKPDIILMDLNLPDMSGIEVVYRLKKDPDLLHIPIIVITADGSEENYYHCMSAGCNGFLTKPIHRATLLKMVEDFISPSPTQ